MTSLKYIPLGGVGTTLNKNLHIYETETDILIVDCGVSFPEAEEFGVDVIIPDVSYLKPRKHKIRGIVVTHGNYDHFAALPYVLADIGNPPIYTAKLTRGFIQSALEENKMLKGQNIHIIEPEADSFNLGGIHITPFRINHSVPDTMGLFIETSAGNFVHVPDYKFDWTPADGKKFEVQKLARLSEKGVLCLMSDCLGATQEGYALSERFIQPTLERFIKSAPKQVFITTISSNINRIQQIINASVKFGRKVIPLGRSVSQNVEMSLKLGYIKTPRGMLITPQEARNLPYNQRAYITAGSLGQRGSALQRLSLDENRGAKLKRDDMVIFSGHPIPGTYDQIDRVIDNLTESGAQVIYSEIQEALHTSGHGGRGDISLLVNLVSPQYFVPTGGTFKHMRAFSLLLKELEYDRKNVFEVKEGQVLEFHDREPKLGEKISTRKIFVDGSLVGDVGRVVLSDRLRLAEEGVFVVIVKKRQKGKLDSRVDVVSRGFVYMVESEKLINKVREIAGKIISGKTVHNWPQVKEKLERQLRDLFYKKTKRKPMVLPVLVNV